MFKEPEKNVSDREIDAVPDSFGNNKHARAYYGAFRLALGDSYFEELGAEDGQAFIDEA